jgi:3-methylfumaryl-CoA hydratase
VSVNSSGIESDMALDIEHLKQWIGRTESITDVVTTTPLRALAATLDRDDPAPRPGDPVPPCWHWLYFLPVHPQSELGPDGHAKRGGFLPPVPLPRRMWAGSRCEFLRPLRVGDAIRRDSRIADVSGKQGRSGMLIFVNVRHEISDESGVAIVDEHDIVYRDDPKPGDSPVPIQLAPASHHWARTIQPDDVLLFRYSALTFNGHRIHYDRRYATEVEGYPGLVVHGPLIATLLLDLLRRNLPGATVARFSLRAMKPTFDLSPFQVCGRVDADGRSVHLWAQHADGAMAMDATAFVT